jgi:hypothetical protein
VTDDRDDRVRGELTRLWDRFGLALGATAELGRVVGQRNLDLWNRVGSNLRSGNGYTANDLTGDAVDLLGTATRNARDMWTVLTSMPVGPAAASGLPMRSLLLKPDPSLPDGAYSLSGDLEEIPVPPEVIEAESIVDIWLTGPDENTAKLLTTSLQPEYSSRSLTLVPQNIPRLPEAKLKPGLYQGVVSVDADTTPRPLAYLWIAVQGPPPGPPGK